MKIKKTYDLYREYVLECHDPYNLFKCYSAIIEDHRKGWINILELNKLEGLIEGRFSMMNEVK